MAVTMKITIFFVVMLYSLIQSYHNFGETCRFHLQSRTVSQAAKLMDIGRGTAGIGSMSETIKIRTKVQKTIIFIHHILFE
jgi:hypothetical protein